MKDEKKNNPKIRVLILVLIIKARIKANPQKKSTPQHTIISKCPLCGTEKFIKTEVAANDILPPLTQAKKLKLEQAFFTILQRNKFNRREDFGLVRKFIKNFDYNEIHEIEIFNGKFYDRQLVFFYDDALPIKYLKKCFTALKINLYPKTNYRKNNIIYL